MNPQIIITIIIIGGALGLALMGVALWIMRQDKKPDEAPEATAPSTEAAVPSEPVEAPPPVTPVEAETAPPPPIALPPEPPPLPAPAWLNTLTSKAPPATPSAPEEELLRLWRSANGDLIVEINGRRYNSRFQIPESTVELRLTNALNDLKDFVFNTLDMPTKATPPPKPPPPSPMALPSLTLSKPAPADRPVVVMTREEAAKQPIEPPSMNIWKQIGNLRAQEQKRQIRIKSMMEEIDDLLQTRIAGTPLAARGLKAADGAQSALFMLDGQAYDSVEALPDPAARAAVRAAIQEWDRK